VDEVSKSIPHSNTKGFLEGLVEITPYGVIFLLQVGQRCFLLKIFNPKTSLQLKHSNGTRQDVLKSENPPPKF
jgi:hypothetical protein